MNNSQLCRAILIVAIISQFAVANDIASIRRAVQDNADSIHSLKVSYTVVQESTPPYTLSPYQVETDFALQGDQRLHHRHPIKSESTGKWVGTWRAYDGTTTHIVAIDSTNPQQIKRIVKTTGYSDEDWLPIDYDFFMGLRPTPLHDSLLNMISSPTAQLVGEEEVDGARCVAVDLGAHLNRLGKGTTWRWTVWLDCDRGYVPRRWRADVEPGSDGSERAKGHFHQFSVLDYKEIPDSILQTRHWLPWELRAENNVAVTTLHVHAATVNSPLPLELFQPAGAFGTEIISRSYATEFPGKVTLIGGPPAVAQRQHELVEKARKSSALSAPDQTSLPQDVPNARPPSFNTRSLWAFAGIAFASAIAVLFYKRRQG